MVKMRYSPKIQSHKKFLTHYLVQKNKVNVLKKPSLFGSCSFEEYKKSMTSQHYKFIISPENPSVPLKDFTFAYMEKINNLLGYKFEWLAAIHNDTEHPHVHILINGKTQDNKILPKRPFPPYFTKFGARQEAGDIVTNIIGERTYEQILLDKEKSITSLRSIPIDKNISELIDEQDSIEQDVLDERQAKRVQFLTKNKIIKFEKNKYTFPKNWQETLVACGRYNTYLDAREKLKFTLPKDFSLYTNKSSKISGKLLKVYCMNDEDVWTNAFVIENKELKKAWYVPLFNSTHRFQKFVGKKIEVENKANSRGLLVPSVYIKDESDEKKKNINYKKKEEKNYGQKR